MYVRMVTASIQPGMLDAAVELWKTSVAPTTLQQAGFIGACMLIDREGSRVRTPAVRRR